MKNLNANNLLREDLINALKEVDTYLDITVDDLMNVYDRASKYSRLRVRGNHIVAEIMSHPVVTVLPDFSLAETAHLLVRHRISSVPVVDEQEQLIGIITEADFLRALGIPANHPTQSVWQTLENMFSHPVELIEPNGCVADLMITDIITVTAEQTLHEVLALMKENKIKRIVVCDDLRHVVGMITHSDIVRIFFDKIKKAPTK